MGFNKKQFFLKLGLGIAKAVVPGVAEVEEILQGTSGAAKHSAVEGRVLDGLTADGIIHSAIEGLDVLTTSRLLADPEFKDGLEMQIKASKKLFNAAMRIRADKDGDGIADS